jgi:hypothetical protein
MAWCEVVYRRVGEWERGGVIFAKKSPPLVAISSRKSPPLVAIFVPRRFSAGCDFRGGPPLRLSLVLCWARFGRRSSTGCNFGRSAPLVAICPLVYRWL